MTHNVGIYARYSTEMQSEASIEDQVRVCERLIQGREWQSLQVYSDQGMSGSTHLRPGYQNLLEDARKGRFEIVVAESLDRISRGPRTYRRFSQNNAVSWHPSIYCQ